MAQIPSTPAGARPEGPSRAWGWMLALASLLILLGLIAMSSLALGARVYVVLLGWLLVGGGALQIGGAFFYRGFGGLGAELLFGALAIVLGAVLIWTPVVAGSLIALLVILGLVADAVIEGVRSALTRHPGWIWPVLLALLAVALAAAVILNPALLLPLLGFVVGVKLVLRGIILLLSALEVRKMSR